MARRQFKVPFAATGDTVSIPDTTQPDGSVSMQQGYGFDYQRDPQTDPLAKVFPRDVHNGLLNEITASIGEIQQQGYPIWTVDGAPYPINAVVRHTDKNWRSTIANNNDEPGVGAGISTWVVAEVRQASEVDPGTLRVGTQAEVDAGTLDDVAVTPLKLANYPKGAFGIGVGQTVKNVTGIRSANTTYTNTSGRTIFVFIALSDTGNTGVSLVINGEVLLSTADLPIGPMQPIAMPIPAGAQYRLNGVGLVFIGWLEMS